MQPCVWVSKLSAARRILIVSVIKAARLIRAWAYRYSNPLTSLWSSTHRIWTALPGSDNDSRSIQRMPRSSSSMPPLMPARAQTRSIMWTRLTCQLCRLDRMRQLEEPVSQVAQNYRKSVLSMARTHASRPIFTTTIKWTTTQMHRVCSTVRTITAQGASLARIAFHKDPSAVDRLAVVFRAIRRCTWVSRIACRRSAKFTTTMEMD